MDHHVERWFGYLTDQLLRRGVHKSVQALEKDICTWIKLWNDDPKPFIWNKTAEEILDSLARYSTNYWRRTLSTSMLTWPVLTSPNAARSSSFGCALPGARDPPDRRPTVVGR